LGTVVKIGLYENHLRGTVLFRSPSNHQVPHREALTAHHETARADDYNAFSTQLVSDFGKILLIRNETRTEFRIGEPLHADEVRNILPLTHREGDVDSERII
jgi:hypothetical protein